MASLGIDKEQIQVLLTAATESRTSDLKSRASLRSRKNDADEPIEKKTKKLGPFSDYGTREQFFRQPDRRF